MMNYKIFNTMILIVIMFTSGCSIFKKISFYPEIYQGNYITIADIAKIHLGMTKQQVAYTLGTAIMHDPFGSNTWYYISRYQLRNKVVIQQKWILIFNTHNLLTYIDNHEKVDLVKY